MGCRESLRQFAALLAIAALLHSLCVQKAGEQFGFTTGATVAGLESGIIGIGASFLMPFALKFTGMFWDIHGKYHILEGLAEGIGGDSGHYSFAKK